MKETVRSVCQACHCECGVLVTVENGRVTKITGDPEHPMNRGFVCVKGQAQNLSKNVLQNKYALKVVPAFGAKGMSWMKVVEGRLQSNIVQFFNQEEQDQIITRFQELGGEGFTVNIEHVSEIPMTRTGKRRYIISDILKTTEHYLEE